MTADRTFRALIVLTLVNTVGFIVAVTWGPPWPPALSWLLAPIIIGLAARISRRVKPDPAASAAVRRYWRWTTAGLMVFSAATAIRFVDAIGVGVSLFAFATVVHTIGAILMITPLLLLSMDRRTRLLTAGHWLDVGTLMVAAGILIYHFTASRAPDLFSLVAMMAAGLINVYVAAKVVLASVEWMSRRALYAIGAASVIGGLGSAGSMLLPAELNTNPLILLLPFAAFAAALSARLQIAGNQKAARSYSLMPYVAVAAVYALLIRTAFADTEDHLLVEAVAIVLTGIVIVRQLIAFHQNDGLLTRIGLEEKRFRLLVQNSTDVVTITALDGELRYISPAVHSILGLDPDTVTGADIAGRIHPEDLGTVYRTVALVSAEQDATATYEMRLRHADGTYRRFEVICANMLDQPSVGGLVSNSRDITETRQVQDRLSYQATHDVLTGLANRALFGEHIEAKVADADLGTRFSLVLIDLDDFKTVNDALGHAAGDALLVHVAERMRARVRPDDLVARLGGDEFAILIEDLDAGAVDAMLARIADALLEPALIDGELLSVRASFGVVDGHRGDDAGDLLRRADIAMYDAKDRGEGGYRRYRPGMEARGAAVNRTAAALRTAIDEDQLVLHYQPVVSLLDGRVTGVEALVRWQHPTDGLLGPGAFIAAAEQSGLIVPLGRWVLREATRQAAAWTAEYGSAAPRTMSVNASARQLAEPEFTGEVAEALRNSGLSADRLTIEITETTAIGGGSTRDTMRELRATGVRLSLDDFGTGASTLSLLASCPVDQIKLDRSFVPGPGPAAIALAVLQLAKAFGVEAVAEGVETPAQAERLTNLGYERAQGFLFARPMPAGQLSATMAALVSSPSAPR
jgi:diguanylate cyclase (GGDEF)-like protein/PAS domain S-box-containing protein